MEVVQNNMSTLQSQCGVDQCVELTPNDPPPIYLGDRTYLESVEFIKELKAQVSQLQLELNTLYQLPGIHFNSDTCQILEFCKSSLARL